MDNIMEHYNAVLRDIRAKQAKYRQELAELDQAEIAIGKLLASQASLFTAIPQSNPAARYSNMSVRWAVLNLLSEDATGPLATPEIARRLEEGGITTKGARFSSIVSAVISTMKAKGEVEGEGTYQLTQMGREAWQHIKITPRYMNRGLSSAILQ